MTSDQPTLGRIVDLRSLWEDALSTGSRGSDEVPLSENEQRILHEIERSFYENDPAFAREVRSASLFRHAGRNCKWAALGFVAGLALLLVSFASSLFLGVAGFLIMLACAFVF